MWDVNPATPQNAFEPDFQTGMLVRDNILNRLSRVSNDGTLVDEIDKPPERRNWWWIVVTNVIFVMVVSIVLCMKRRPTQATGKIVILRCDSIVRTTCGSLYNEWWRIFCNVCVRQTTSLGRSLNRSHLRSMNMNPVRFGNIIVLLTVCFVGFFGSFVVALGDACDVGCNSYYTVMTSTTSCWQFIASENNIIHGLEATR